MSENISLSEADAGSVDSVISPVVEFAGVSAKSENDDSNAEVCFETSSAESNLNKSDLAEINVDEVGRDEIKIDGDAVDGGYGNSRDIDAMVSQSTSLEAYKEATLKLLDQVTSDVSSTDTSEIIIADKDESIGGDSVESLETLPEIRTQYQSTAVLEQADQEAVTIPVSNDSDDVDNDNFQTSARSYEADQFHVVTTSYDSVSINEVDTPKELTESESNDILMINSDSEQINCPKPTSTSFDLLVDQTSEGDSGKFIAVPLVPKTHTDEPLAKKQKLNLELDTNAITDESCISQDVVAVTETPNTYLEEFTTRQSVFKFKGSPKQLTGAWKSFEDPNMKNYLRGCKWAPDGTCLLTNSNDNTLKIFNLPDELYYDGGENKIIPEMSHAVEMKEADTVYDFCWYPLMSSSQPETACLAVTSKDTPTHLYDAFTGEIRCSYRSYNHVDEVVAAHCIEFSPDGSKLYCGFNKMIRVFDVTRPGRSFVSRPTFAKDGQRGIISCITHSPLEPGLYAAGSYSRSIALYSEPEGSMVCMFEGQHGGVTQVKFSPDGTKLYSGGRKDNEILCWDMRNPGQILFTLQRTVTTNQRIYFDITCDSMFVVSGSNDGIIRVWDTTASPKQPSVHLDPVIEPTMTFQAHIETVNSVSLHPTLPVIATGSGERHFKSMSDNDDDSKDMMENTSSIDNSIRLWWT